MTTNEELQSKIKELDGIISSLSVHNKLERAKLETELAKANAKLVQANIDNKAVQEKLATELLESNNKVLELLKEKSPLSMGGVA